MDGHTDAELSVLRSGSSVLIRSQWNFGTVFPVGGGFGRISQFLRTKCRREAFRPYFMRPSSWMNGLFSHCLLGNKQLDQKKLIIDEYWASVDPKWIKLLIPSMCWLSSQLQRLDVFRLRFFFRRVATRSQLKTEPRMAAGTQRAAPPHMERYGRPLLLLLLGLLLRLCSAVTDDRMISDRYAVYWNSSNPR